MGVITGLRRAGADRVVVDVDGARWRVLPEEAVVRCRLAIGVELDRPRLRALRTELRRAEALATAVRALGAREHSSASLDDRLERRGIAATERRRAIATLERAGLVDDDRFAHGRAAALAGRGGGDLLIGADLEAHGIPPDLVAAALGALEPEAVRAARLFAARGGGARAARYLTAKGFSECVVETLVAGSDDRAVG